MPAHHKFTCKAKLQLSLLIKTKPRKEGEEKGKKSTKPNKEIDAKISKTRRWSTMYGRRRNWTDAEKKGY